MSITYPDKRVERTQHALKIALMKLLAKKALHKIHISEITEEAGVSRGTFYTHYEKKEDLLDELSEDMLEEMTIAFRKPYEQLGMVDLRSLPSESIILFDHFLENKAFYQLMLGVTSDNFFKEKMTDQLHYLFRTDYAFYFRQIDAEIDLELFCTYRIHGMIGMIVEWIQKGFDKPAPFMAEQLLHIFRFHTESVMIRH
ncbi:TetR/AcrR family transcriptional regulator [Terribacillus saccharophilus]|uniref:TetR/AcrR family transcriptional regulator n=1 Tax=Terribacillus saccharophilus TaxID=361277 RepID=UPI002989C135|nr:TetR/AcrR family transcriptional regulator [Terribacillus saccharophilus]MCM3226044.1 TetR/AcrR family transcriptional regulator [Terribacillus saccharophilus]